MNLLQSLGIAALLFTIAFTLRAYRSGPNPRAAIIESWVNIAIGFSVNFTINFAILPLVNVSMTAMDNWWLGWIYTSISIGRQYAIRRWFQDRIHRAVIAAVSSVGTRGVSWESPVELPKEPFEAATNVHEYPSGPGFKRIHGRTGTPWRHPVIDNKSGRAWASIKDCASEVGVSQSGLAKAVRERRKIKGMDIRRAQPINNLKAQA